MVEKLVKIGKFIFYTSTIFLTVCLFIYRSSVWINEPGFFGDEGALIYNIQTRNFFQLFLPLDQAQCCPPLFLCFAKIIYMIFGVNETALRFFPYISGVAACILSFFAGNKVFKFKSLSLILFSLMIYDYNLSYYSQEFKQYSSDVFFSLLIFYSFLVFKNKIDTNKKALLFGICLGLTGFISLPAEFVVVPICFYYLFLYLKEKQYKRLLCMSLPYITLSVALFFLMVFKTLQGNMLDLPMWAEGCDTFKSLQTVKDLFLYIFSTDYHLLTVMFFVGLLFCILKNRFLIYFMVFPILLNILFGYCHLYPFTISRVILWLVPFMYIISLKSFDFLKTKNNVANICVEILIFIFAILSFHNIYQNKIEFTTPCPDKHYYFYTSNAKEYVKKLENVTVKPTDVVFVDCQGEGIFDIYDKDNKYFGKNVIYQSYKEPLNFIGYGSNIQEVSDKIHLDDLAVGTKIYFYNYKYSGDEGEFGSVNKWIEENTKILFNENDAFGEFYYVEKIK